MCNKLKGIVYDFKRFSVNDGPGIRQTVFLKGCPLNCWWCHNPESQNIKSEKLLKKYLLDGNVFSQSDTIGELMTVNEVMDEILKDYLFYDESNGGVTFSGGEPLLQHEFLNALLINCKKSNIHTAVDTSGYTDFKVFGTIMKNADLFLYDLKHMDEKLHKKYTGVSNKNILNNLLKLDQENKKVVIRFPVIPGINNDENNIAEMLLFLKKLKNIRKLTLLPYHHLAKHKYKKLEMNNKMKNIMEPQQADLTKIKRKFKAIGFEVRIGS